VQRELSDIIDAIGDLVIQRDGDGRLTYVNAAFRRAFGGELADWVGRVFAPVPENLITAPGGRRRYDAGHDTVAGLARYEWEETPLAAGGVIAVGRDVSTTRAGESALKGARDAAEEEARTKGELFATVTHELRTPLNGVLGLAQILNNTPLNSEQRDYVHAIEESGHHLLGLVEDILDAAKLAADGAALSAIEVDPRVLVESVAGLVAPRANEKGLDIAVAIDPATPRLVAADAGRLRQVLLNLMGNAVKFTETGGVALSVDVEAVDADEATLVFKVRDTGPGVREADRARIFEAFTQGDSSAARKAEGVGLGLSIVRGIIDAMGGDIGLETNDGEGSTFWARVRLPVRAPAELHVAASLTGQRILIAAPDALGRETLARQLTLLGAKAEPIATLADLDAQLDENSDRLVIIDEAWAEVAVSSAVRARAALVLLAPTERGALKARLAAGYAGWLIKPCRLESLIDRVTRAWSGERSSGVESDLDDAQEHARLADAAPTRVLLVEDNPINRLLAMTLLKRMDCIAEAAETGEAALEALEARTFDLVFMDMRLPGMDGLETTRRLRAIEGSGRRTPVVALTANATADDRRACLEIGRASCRERV